MGIWETVLLVLAGLVLIVKGGDWFLSGAVWMAEATGVPRFLIGATVVSLVTTMPELAVSVMGVLEGETELAVSNAVGSVTANLGLILGLSVLCAPAKTGGQGFSRKAVLMTAAAAILTGLCRRGQLHLLPGLLLTGVFALDLRSAAEDARRSLHKQANRRAEADRKLLAFAAGISAVILGSRLLVDHGSALARLCGVPAGVVGATVVAVGTSLPELVTTLTALARGEAALSIGNIIGANVMDLTMILPVCAAVSGGSLPIGRQTRLRDLPICLVLCLLSVVPTLVEGRFRRWQGVVLLGVYSAYMAALVL